MRRKRRPGLKNGKGPQLFGRGQRQNPAASLRARSRLPPTRAAEPEPYGEALPAVQLFFITMVSIAFAVRSQASQQRSSMSYISRQTMISMGSVHVV